MAPIRVREATLDDLDLLVRHRRRMWEDIGDHDAAALDAADPVYRRWARQRMRTGRFAGFVAEERGAPVGSGCVWVQAIQPRPLAPTLQPYLLSMFTEPAHRGRGVAARIVETAADWCAARGFARMTLHAAPMGRGIYERAGFERTWEMKLDLSRRSSTASTRRAGSRAGSRTARRTARSG